MPYYHACPQKLLHLKKMTTSSSAGDTVKVIGLVLSVAVLSCTEAEHSQQGASGSKLGY